MTVWHFGSKWLPLEGRSNCLVYIYMCIYIYMYIYIYISVYIYICIYVYIYICIYVYMYMYIYICIYIILKYLLFTLGLYIYIYISVGYTVCWILANRYNRYKVPIYCCQEVAYVTIPYLGMNNTQNGPLIDDKIQTENKRPLYSLQISDIINIWDISLQIHVKQWIYTVVIL